MVCYSGELLQGMREKIFIYKNKEVAINFETPQFSDLYKFMDADGGQQEALGTGQSNSS